MSIRLPAAFAAALTLATTAAVGLLAPAAHAAVDTTRTPGLADYTVTLQSDSTGASWTGHESVTFTNTSPSALPEVYLRLWDNYHGASPSTQITVSAVTGGTASALTVGCTAMKITLPA